MSKSPLSNLAAGFIAGMVFWGGFNWSLELTNTESFCISCHAMEAFPFAEYKQTVHYTNRTGARASCPDCHVPKEWLHKVVRKVQASYELGAPRPWIWPFAAAICAQIGPVSRPANQAPCTGPNQPKSTPPLCRNWRTSASIRQHVCPTTARNAVPAPMFARSPVP